MRPPCVVHDFEPPDSLFREPAEGQFPQPVGKPVHQEPLVVGRRLDTEEVAPHLLECRCLHSLEGRHLGQDAGNRSGPPIV